MPETMDKRLSTDGALKCPERPSDFDEVMQKAEGLMALGDTVWVLRDGLTEQSSGRHGKAIHISTGWTLKRRRGWAVAVGPGEEYYNKKGKLIKKRVGIPRGAYVLFDRHYVRADEDEDEWNVLDTKLVGISSLDIHAWVEWVSGMPIFHPLRDTVLIVRDRDKGMTEGGLYIPDVAKERALEAMVLTAGPGRINENGDRVPPVVFNGDRVLIGQYTGIDIEVDGKVYTFVSERDILATM